MKRLLLTCIFAASIFGFGDYTHAALTTTACGNIGENTVGCNECFIESTKIYGCNPYQQSCNKEGLAGLTDTLINTGNTQLVQWIDGNIGPGKWQYYKLQTSTTWSVSGDPIWDMPANFGPVYTSNGGDRYTIYNPGDSKVWSVMKSGHYYRFDEARSGTDISRAVFRVDFVPQTQAILSTNPTVLGDVTPHRQCLFYYPSFCGDGTQQSSKGEQCDDGNMISGDGCSNACQTEQVTQPSCNSLIANPTTIVGQTTVTFTCNATQATSYEIVVRRPDNSVLQVFNTSTGSVTIPATPDGTYTARCTINGSITNNQCTASVTNNPQIVPSIEIIKDDNDTPHDDYQLVNVGGTANFSITVRNNGTEALNNVSISDALAPNCSLSVAQAAVLIGQVGNNNSTFDPNESFTYVCQRGNVQTNTFPDGINTICTEGTGVSSGIEVDDCDPTNIETPNPNPKITIIKDDSDNHDDRQTVQVGGTAEFDITVYNNGSESLKDLIISDQFAPNCARTAAQTRGMIDDVGNGDQYLDPGESFTYTCNRTNVQTNTFPNNQNIVCVDAKGKNSNQDVNACNPTYVFTENPNPKIRIIKDDNDNYDDRQQIDEGGRAQFTIIVENTGPEPLVSVVIDDPRAPDCDRSSSETRALYSGTTFDPGEKFSYTCSRSNVSTNTFPNDENVACVDARGEVSSKTVSDCDPTRIFFDRQGKPSIKIVKDDADNHDDRQRIISGEVRFDIAVINDGDVSLENVVIDDPRASACDRSASQTKDLYPGNTFDPGEKFGYTCRVFGVDMSDFPGGENEACVEAREVDGNGRVTHCDKSKVEPGSPDFGKCEKLTVDKKFGTGELTAKFTCVGDAKDRYRLDILTGSGDILRTLSSSDGEFEHKFGIGEYITRCRIDDETTSRSSCEQRIEVEDARICEAVVSSAGSYGPAPFKTRISCDANPGDNCLMEVVDRKSGKVVNTFNVCERELKFKNAGKYDVRCVINGVRDNRCSTPITIESPTKPQTGGAMSAAAILILLAAPAAWLGYRRKKI